MPIEVGIWNVKNSNVNRLSFSSIESESKLEDILEKDFSIIDENILVVGRQIATNHGKYIDILGITADGELAIYELKKQQTPREVVAQTIDYASWVQALSYKELIDLYEEKNQDSLEEAFEGKFGVSLPEELNNSHRMVIICAELDSATERIIQYLSTNYDVPINAVYFRFFKENDNEYLTRTWLIDPADPMINTSPSKVGKKKEPWNQRDFVVNFDDGVSRSWQDARRYGFVSAGNGKWFSRTLNNLFVGARVFCMIPGKGYVGVGTVTRKAVPLKQAEVDVDGQVKKLLKCELTQNNFNHDLDDMEKCEYIVTVDWDKSYPIKDAYWTKGLRANQNSAYKLTNQFTIEKLESFFKC
ncbi:PDDEXK family nuclease [Sporosarcina obsidiansis]|uniref:DUF91 domain-containing protein n=1 Tax=Sporosarcina obsidiansis TaxID=2660748 RepID=UPI00129A6440|nr:DUF91 domain-containing protein [Sporosarcina obsidiansis]